ncbi:hypothetical protein D9C73_018709 [Collichthys lucidus]|uniref:Secreted protein n=1 Tax=Collichthys lucidus TaxID=240159 RepID=A0A4U5V962_COLLU|nr:hypothetical protein D9C73_018709 [Collichthys lucidus]
MFFLCVCGSVLLVTAPLMLLTVLAVPQNELTHEPDNRKLYGNKCVMASRSRRLAYDIISWLLASSAGNVHWMRVGNGENTPITGRQTSTHCGRITIEADTHKAPFHGKKSFNYM